MLESNGFKKAGAAGDAGEDVTVPLACCSFASMYVEAAEVHNRPTHVQHTQCATCVHFPASFPQVRATLTLCWAVLCCGVRLCVLLCSC